MTSIYQSLLIPLVAIAGLASSTSLDAQRPQPTTILVTVVDELSRRPLANADVIDRSSGRQRLTNEDGRVTLTWPADGRLNLRVREVGYKPIERTLKIEEEGATGTATLGMSRVAYVIAPVRKMARCVNDADSASRFLSVAVLEQLRQGAEKYEHFRKSYPFQATIERRTMSARRKPPGTRVFSRKEKYRSESWEEKYQPGNIVRGANSPLFQVPILFLSTLADPSFWEHHCFVARGMETLNGARVVRLEFSPSPNTGGPDWEGAALLDSATSILKRVEFRVANLGKNRGPQRIEGYTVYRSPSPFVVMPDTTIGIWWLRRPDTDGRWGDPEVGEMLTLVELKYLKQSPPAVSTASTPR